MKTMGKILSGVAAAVAVLSIAVATRPATFHVERSTTVDAPAEAAFALVNDFHAWSSWSPYDKLDPQMKKTYEGPASGVGASYSWQGNDKAGEGRSTIVSSDPSRVVFRLEFLKPFAATDTAAFAFVPSDGKTKVTWSLDGQNGFVAKAASMVMDMDKLVGTDFEQGLATIKSLAEAKAKSAPTTSAPR